MHLPELTPVAMSCHFPSPGMNAGPVLLKPHRREGGEGDALKEH